MRLRQLARKLSVNEDKIRGTLLSELQVELPEGPNIKLEDEHVNFLSERFAPLVEETPEEEASIEETVESSTEPAVVAEEQSEEESTPEVVEETAEAEETETEEASEDTPTEVMPEEAIEEATEVVAEESEGSDDAEGSEDEPIANEVDGVIRKPVVELPGLTVVGKIDLPEPVEREMPQIEIDGVMYDKKPGRKRREDERRKKKTGWDDDKKPNENRRPVRKMSRRVEKPKTEYTADQKREEEIKRLKALRERDLEYRKAKAKEHYNERFKPKGPQPKKKKPKKVKEAEEKRQMQTAKPKAEPKSGLGKLWRWFNSD